MNNITRKKIARIEVQIENLAALNNNVGNMFDLLKFNIKTKSIEFSQISKGKDSINFDESQIKAVKKIIEKIKELLIINDFKIESNMKLIDTIIINLQGLRNDYKTQTPSTRTNKIYKFFKGRSAVTVFNRRDKVYEFIDSFIRLIISFKTNIKLNLSQLNQITEYEDEIIELQEGPSLRAQSHAGGGNPSNNNQNNVNKILKKTMYYNAEKLLSAYKTYDDAEKLLQELNIKSFSSYEENDLILYSPENVNQLIVSINENNGILDLYKENLIPMLETIIKLKKNEIKLINENFVYTKFTKNETNAIEAELDGLNNNTNTTTTTTAAELAKLEEEVKAEMNDESDAEIDAEIEKELAAILEEQEEKERLAAERLAAERQSKKNIKEAQKLNQNRKSRTVIAAERKAKREADAAKREADAAERKAEREAERKAAAAKREADAAKRKAERAATKLTKKGGSLKKTKKVKKSNKKSKTLKK